MAWIGLAKKQVQRVSGNTAQLADAQNLLAPNVDLASPAAGIAAVDQDEVLTTHILIGMEMLRTRAADFERFFDMMEAPVSARWPALLIWIEAHSRYEPWGILIESNGKVAAAAIFTRCRRFGVWRIGIPAGPCADSVDFSVVDDRAAERLARALLDSVRSFGGFWYLEIPDLSPDSVVRHLLRSWTHSTAQHVDPVPKLLFKSGAQLNDFLSRNTRAAVAKARSRIRREGIEMTQDWTCDPLRIIKLLPNIQDICRHRDYQKFGKSLMDDAVTNRYYVAFMTEHARRGLIDLLSIYLNGELAAFALCLLDNGQYSILTNRASPKWLRYSPGTIANAEIVRHAYEDGRRSGVNWGGGLERYKLSGDVTLIPRLNVYAWSSPAARLLLLLPGKLVRLRNRCIARSKKIFFRLGRAATINDIEALRRP